MFCRLGVTCLQPFIKSIFINSSDTRDKIKKNYFYILKSSNDMQEIKQESNHF